MRGFSGEDEKRQDAYVEARLQGVPKPEAGALAGYPPASISRLETPGTPTYSKIQKALESQGINEDFLASEYRRGMAEAASPQGRVGDYTAHSKYLLQLSYLMGYGRKDPTVAVQINNPGNTINQEHDPERTRIALEEATAILRVLQAEIESRKPAGVPSGGPEVTDVSAHAGVVPPGDGTRQVTSGGGA